MSLLENTGLKPTHQPDYSPFLQLQKASWSDPDKISLYYKDFKCSVKQSFDYVLSLAQYYNSIGIGFEDAIAISTPNHPVHLFTYVACAYLGAIVVPINPRLSENEKQYILNQIQPKLHITSNNLEEIFNQCFTSKIPDFAPYTIDEQTLAAVLFTSGTSGKPKGVRLTHKNLWWGSTNFREGFGYSQYDHELLIAPMSHIGGFNGCTADMFVRGASITIADDLSPQVLLKTIKKRKITVMFAVPTIYQSIVSVHTGKYLDSLRLPLIGGAPISQKLINDCRQVGLNLICVWGMTEISASGALLPQKIGMQATGEPHSKYLPNMATAFQYIDLKIIDIETGKEITQPDIVGHLLAGGPSVSSGYWGFAPYDSENYIGEYLITKDLACWKSPDKSLSNNAFIQITGRANDSIISGGEHIFPNEVNNEIENIGWVQTAESFGVPDKYWGQKLVTAVVLSQHSTAELDQEFLDNYQTIQIGEKSYNVVCSHIALQQIKQYLQNRITGYKIPKEILVIGEIPLTSASKVDKKVLEKIHKLLHEKP